MQSAPSRRQPAFALALVTLTTALTGCLGGGNPEESVKKDPLDEINHWANTSASGLRVDGLRIVTTGEPVSRLHEDDIARVLYTVRHPGSPEQSVARFVSFSLNGVIVDVENVELSPDGVREFDWPVGSLRGRDAVKVEVRVANETLRVDAPVSPWPRTGDKLDLHNMTLRVNRWLKNTTTSGTDVNVTIYQKDHELDDVGNLTARILCADDAGIVTDHGKALMAMPGAWTFGTTDLRLPGCPRTLYGVHFLWTHLGEPMDQRVLFVEAGWRPPNARG